MLLWDIAEDKIIHGCKRKPIKFAEKKKCLVDVVVCLQPPASYKSELDTENAAGRNTILHLSCFSRFPLETEGLEGQMPALTQPSLYSYNCETHTSQQAPCQHLPPFCPSSGNSSSNYLATAVVPLQLCGLECQEQLG